MAGRPAASGRRRQFGLSPDDPRFAAAISLDEAERRLRKDQPPVLFAMVGGPVVAP